MASNELGTYVGRIDSGWVEGALSSVLALCGDAVLFFDASGTISYANEQAARLFAHSPKGLVGTDVHLLFAPAEDAGPVRSAVTLGYAEPSRADSGTQAPIGLPFSTDGTATVHTCADPHGNSVEVRVRCAEVRGSKGSYLLVARRNDEAEAAESERDRLVVELSRANKRLAGTLDIVLGTIDSGDVATLFSRALNEITKTMESDGTVMYLAENDGFHLRGLSDHMSVERVPRFMAYGRAIGSLATREGRPLCLTVLPPEREELRRGRVTVRRVADEATGHIYKVHVAALPPFTSFIAVPVWFGGHVIALLETGWASTRHMREDDAKLLDAVAQYLSVQLMGAFSAMRAQKRDQLAATSSRLREKIMAADTITCKLLAQVLGNASGELGATLVVLEPMADGYLLRVRAKSEASASAGNTDDGSASSAGTHAAAGPASPAVSRAAAGSSATPDASGSIGAESSDGFQTLLGTDGRPLLLPASVLQSDSKAAVHGTGKSNDSGPNSGSAAPTMPDNPSAAITATAVRPGASQIPAASKLSNWLAANGLVSVGAVVDLGVVEGEPFRALVLRGASAMAPGEPEPLSDMEVDFLDAFAVDVCELVAGGEEHAQDKRIAQALQSGMRNELQEVKGISAQGLYSSATAQAFVGGDFYDLIRLPGRRACVIMGDVSGKGVEAASVSAAVRTALGAYAWEGLRPARMVRSLNDFLLGFSRVETFATLFVGIVDLEKGSLTYCSAGHPPALLLRASTGEISLLDVQSGVVGAFKDILYQDGKVRIRPGDMLLLYTDGTTESRAPDGAFFGEEGLRDAVMREWQLGFDGITDRLLATLDRFTHNNLDDDVAIVALRFDEVGKAAKKS